MCLVTPAWSSRVRAAAGALAATRWLSQKDKRIRLSSVFSAFMRALSVDQLIQPACPPKPHV